MARPTTTERGYGADHQKERQRWARLVEKGEANCTRCLNPIELTPDGPEPWDLDHNEDRTAYLGPAHRHCNRARRTTQQIHTIRDW